MQQTSFAIETSSTPRIEYLQIITKTQQFSSTPRRNFDANKTINTGTAEPFLTSFYSGFLTAVWVNWLNMLVLAIGLNLAFNVWWYSWNASNLKCLTISVWNAHKMDINITEQLKNFLSEKVVWIGNWTMDPMARIGKIPIFRLQIPSFERKVHE